MNIRKKKLNLSLISKFLNIDDKSIKIKPVIEKVY